MGSKSKSRAGDTREFVFFVRHKDDETPHGLIYIASSLTPMKVFEEMKVLSPVTLVYLGAVSAHQYPERWWRTTLLPWNVRGNWYKPSAQVLCLIEDVRSHKIAAPGPHFDALEAVPAHIRPLTKEEERRKRWAFPKPDPYPLLTSESVRAIPATSARSLALRALTRLAASSSGTSPDHLVKPQQDP
jgi:hypothetical protein